MQDFTITAHIEFPSKSQAIKTAQIRMVVPAENEAQARQKATEFIKSKAEVVIDKCLNPTQKQLEDVFQQMGTIFK
ncbi:hypothetical protein [Hymenobacter pini]|uniref:hypothetical protein n=1 Tax=Hymenobacter pini TaxID=2880879 RepID=UPI001CF4920C|nr:hypothetical protein [Hymenobacter pini]MCA8830549.1 hypothetical protein [Hymenobacter pini]